MERIGIYGGNFDPPHLGHVQAARQAISDRNLDKLLIVPSLAAPKTQSLPDTADLSQRLEMLQLCFTEVPSVEIHSPEEFPDRYCPDDQRVEESASVLTGADMRRLLAFRCADELLTDEVARYIQINNLYGTGKNLRHLPMERLEQEVISLLKPNRVAHVLGCRDTAASLARVWGVDETDAARAGLLHDITKALDGPLQLVLCRAYGVQLDNFSQHNPKTLHALTGSLVARRIFGENQAVVDAICSHTTGKANMNTLEKIIYVADYMEPNRTIEGVEQLRQLAYTDLDKALRLGLEMTLTMLRQQGREISPESQQALAWLNRKEEIDMLTAKQVAYEVTKALDSKKGQDIKLLKISDVSSLADYFIICTGTSNTHVKTLCDYAEYTFEQMGEPMLGREGHRGNTWELLDFGSVVVHVFTEEAREFYALERLWADAEAIDLSDIVTPD